MRWSRHVTREGENFSASEGKVTLAGETIFSHVATLDETAKSYKRTHKIKIKEATIWGLIHIASVCFRMEGFSRQNSHRRQRKVSIQKQPVI